MTWSEEPLPAKHPLADSSGEGSVRIETRADVVHLSAARLDLVGKAARAGGRTIIVSDGQSRLTEPMRAFLEEMNGHWVVRGQHELRDALNGRRLDRFEDAILVPPPQSVDDVSLPWLGRERPDATQLVVSASIRHRASDETYLGGAAELLVADLAGEAPAGWGTHEPTSQRWDRGALTAFARERMPSPTRLVVTGTSDARAALTLDVHRTDVGVEELLTGLVGAGPIGATSTADSVARVPLTLARLAEAQLPLFALVLARPGRADLLVSALAPLPPTPVAMLIGAPAVRALGLDPAVMRERHGAQVVGRPRLPALLFAFGGRDDVDPVTELGDVLRFVGPERVFAATGASGRTGEELRRAAEQ